MYTHIRAHKLSKRLTLMDYHKKFLKLSASCEAGGRSASQEMNHILLNEEVHHRVHNSSYAHIAFNVYCVC
jgi:hypothetical protein